MSGRLVIVVLIYVAFDLSLAFMPGAFVFEAGDSVESVQRGRTYATATPTMLARDPRDVVTIDVAIQRPHVGDRDVPTRSPNRVRTRPPRSNAAPEPAPPSEDSH